MKNSSPPQLPRRDGSFPPPRVVGRDVTWRYGAGDGVKGGVGMFLKRGGWGLGDDKVENVVKIRIMILFYLKKS